MRRQCARTPRTADGRPQADDVDDVVERLARTELAHEIILFGSGATHRMGPRSDLDFYIITNGNADRDTRRALARAVPQNRAVDLVFDTILGAERAAEYAGLIREIANNGVTMFHRGRRRSWETAGARPGPNPSRTGRVRELEKWIRESEQVDAAEEDWRAANGYRRRKKRAFTNHRIGFLSRRAAVHALRGRTEKAGHTWSQGSKLQELLRSVENATRTELWTGTDAELQGLANMHKWLFTGEADPSDDETARALSSAARILTACGLQARSVR